MSRHPTVPLRPLTADEEDVLGQISRSRSEPAVHVERAKLLLSVAAGASFSAAARAVGRRSNDAVAHLVSRFNREGLAALHPRHAGGSEPRYGPTERQRILAEAQRPPDRAHDGSASWSLSLLQQALRTAPDGLPSVSTYTIWRVLHEAGYAWQRDRSWCPTGQSVRQRKAGPVTVVDPDAEAKKN